MSYQNLYSMPCRLPCNRYTGYGDLFEAAAGNPTPIPSKESYGYEPTVENYGQPAVFQAKKIRKKMKNKNVNKHVCNCQPMVYVHESYDYDPNVFQQESYEYEPSVNREGFQESADCGCGVNNPPYRMENCGYNQSPSWVTQNMFNQQPAGSNVAQMISSPQQIRQMARPQMASREVPSSAEADCGCAMDNPPYRMENCGYNQSPTWNDQSAFRQNIQNKY